MAKKVKALANSAEFEPQAGSLRWTAIREDYIAQNMARQKGQKAFSLRDCAEAHNVSYHYLRQIAGAQKWNKALKDRIEERQTKAVARITDVAVFDELELRTRHATYAKLASSIAKKKLDGMTDADVKLMSVRDAIDLLKVGLAEERAAFGIRDGQAPPPPPADRVLTDDQVFAAARRVIELRRGDDGSYRADPED